MKNLFAAVLTLVSSAGFTQELNTFSNGDVADANLINDNFVTIDQRLKSIEQSSVTSTSGSNSLEDWGAVGFDTVVIDCEADSAELEKKWSEIGKKKGRVVVDIMGTCVLSQDLTNLFIFSQHVILDGGSEDRASCTSKASIVLPEEIGSKFYIDASNNASLFLFCLDLIASNEVELAGYGNAYIRTFSGVSASNNNLVINLIAGSTFRATHNMPNIKTMRLRSGSVSELYPLEGTVLGNLRLQGSSGISIVGSTGDFSVLSANLRGQSSVDISTNYTPTFNFINVGQNSTVSYRGGASLAIYECQIYPGGRIFDNDYDTPVECPIPVSQPPNP